MGRGSKIGSSATTAAAEPGSIAILEIDSNEPDLESTQSKTGIGDAVVMTLEYSQHFSV